MARHFIKGAKTKKGEKLFWSDRDGDRPNDQTVYRKHNSIFGGNSRVKSRYNPSTGKFKKSKSSWF